jgi:hypothetical protein
MKKLLNYLLKRKWWFDYSLKRRLLAAYLADYNKN